jgi:hypothetical protein
VKKALEAAAAGGQYIILLQVVCIFLFQISTVCNTRDGSSFVQEKSGEQPVNELTGIFV